MILTREVVDVLPLLCFSIKKKKGRNNMMQYHVDIKQNIISALFICRF